MLIASGVRLAPRARRTQASQPPGSFVGLFTIGPVWLSLVLAGIVIGAIWGAVFGFVAQWATRGQRDFASTRALVAARYDVTVADAYVECARQLLSSPG